MKFEIASQSRYSIYVFNIRLCEGQPLKIEMGLNR